MSTLNFPPTKKIKLSFIIFNSFDSERTFTGQNAENGEIQKISAAQKPPACKFWMRPKPKATSISSAQSETVT